MTIRFFNTHNLVLPLLDHTLPALAGKNIKASAYISAQKYRGSIKGADQVSYFELATLTKLAGKNKRLNQFLYAITASFKILFGRSDLNVFFTQPPLFVIWASWLSRVRGKKYYIHIMDLYPDFLAQTGHLNEEGSLYKWFDNKMVKALRKADKIIVIGKCMERLISQKVGPDVKIDKVINIPMATEEREVTDELAKLDIKAKFTILYAGNMGLAHEFKTYLKVAAELDRSHPDIHFLFLAQGRKRAQAENYISAGHKNLTLIGYPPHEVFMSILLETHLHYISMKTEFNGILVPSKFYSSLAIGKPILYEGPVSSEVGTEIKEHSLGKAVPIGDHEGLKSSILYFYENRNVLDTTGKNVKAYFDEYCNIKNVITGYTDILTK